MPTVDELMPEILKLPVVDRERVICELEASLPDEKRHVFVSDDEVERRLREIESDPAGSTISHDELINGVEAMRLHRRRG